MRIISLLLLYWISSSRLVSGQDRALTKIYFYSAQGTSIKTTLNLNEPIRIASCTLLESPLDSLGFTITQTKTVYIHFKPGQVYYFRTVGGGNYTHPSLVASSEQEFWLNVHMYGTGKYRHYSLDKQTGLNLLEETK